MHIRDVFSTGKLSYSFEFFPPKTDEGEAQLWTTIRELEHLRPTFLSVTEGAGGSTRDRTSRIVRRIGAETTIIPVAHMTCVGSPATSLAESVQDYAAAGIVNLLALRGDPPRDSATFVAAPGGFTHAVELVELIRSLGDFCVGVAGYPEKHPEAPDFESDVQHLAEKLEAGAEFVVTQFFFEAANYFRLVEALQRMGHDAPVVPGIMPVTNVKQIQRMAALQGSAFPAALGERLLAVEDDPEAVRAIGVETATELCQALLDGGAPGLHFFTLNRSTATREIAENLRLAPSAL
jgi:methylenetetrahydrofolate reductase (NADPH)